MSSSTNRFTPMRMMGFVLIVVLALFVINRIASRHAEEAANATAPADRRPAPDFQVATLAGGTWSLAAQKGHVVLINIFATWCQPCRAEMPDMVRLAHDFGPKGVSFLALSMDQDGPAVVRPFVKKYGMDFPVAMAEPGNPITADVTGIPVTMIIDREGRVARTYVGMITPEKVRADLDALLSGK